MQSSAYDTIDTLLVGCWISIDEIREMRLYDSSFVACISVFRTEITRGTFKIHGITRLESGNYNSSALNFFNTIIEMPSQSIDLEMLASTRSSAMEIDRDYLWSPLHFRRMHLLVYVIFDKILHPNMDVDKNS